MAISLRPESSSHFTYVCDKYLAVFELASDYVYGPEDKEFEEEFVHATKSFIKYSNLIRLHSDFANAEAVGAFYKGDLSDDEYVDKAVRDFEGKRATRG